MDSIPKMFLWDIIQGYPSELTNRLSKCWIPLSIITVHRAQLHSPRQTEWLKVQRQHPPLSPNGQESASLQTTVTESTAPTTPSPRPTAQRLGAAQETHNKHEGWMMKYGLTLNVSLNRCCQTDLGLHFHGCGVGSHWLQAVKSSWLANRCKCSALDRGCALLLAALILRHWMGKETPTFLQ